MSPSALYSRVLPSVPGCPEPTVDLAIMDAATDFAKRTQLLFTIESAAPLVDGRATYEASPDGDLDADLIRQVFCGSRELDQVTPSSLRDRLPDWQTATSNEPKLYSCFGEPGTITVYPKPDGVTGQTLRIVASWVPGFTAKTLPDDLVRAHGRDIAEGAKARLMLIPDRKWTNPQLAGVAEGKFEAAVAEGRIRAIHAKGAGSLYVRPRQFGGR